MSRRTLSAALFLAASTLAPAARAADPEQIYQAALAAMKSGNLAEACPMFAEARRLKADSTPALQGLALCFDKAGKTASAWTKYRELSVELKAAGDTGRAQAASDRAAALAPTLATVTVKPDAPDTPGLVIRLDGDDVPRVLLGAKMNVDPGSHAVEATAPGYEVWKTTFLVGAKDASRVIPIPALGKVHTQTTAEAPVPGNGPAPAFAWTSQRTAGLAVAGVGVAGLVVGAVFGARALSQNTASKTQCQPQNPDKCSAAGAAQYHDAQTSAHVSTAGLAAGGALLVTGLVVFLVAKSPVTTGRLEALPLVGADMRGLALRTTW